MKKKKSIHVPLSLDMLRVHISVVICEPDVFLSELKPFMKNAAFSEMKDILEVRPIGDEDGIMFPVQNGGGSVIWLREYSITILVHELIHAMMNVFYKKGMTMSKDSEEILSYGVDYLLGEFLKQYKS